MVKRRSPVEGKGSFFPWFTSFGDTWIHGYIPNGWGWWNFPPFFTKVWHLAYVLSEYFLAGFLNHQTAVKILPQQLQHAPLQLQQVDPSTLEDPGSTTTPRKFPFFSKTGFQRHPFNFNMRSVSKPAGFSDRLLECTPHSIPWCVVYVPRFGWLF